MLCQTFTTQTEPSKVTTEEIATTAPTAPVPDTKSATVTTVLTELAQVINREIAIITQKEFVLVTGVGILSTTLTEQLEVTLDKPKTALGKIPSDEFCDKNETELHFTQFCHGSQSQNKNKGGAKSAKSQCFRLFYELL